MAAHKISRTVKQFNEEWKQISLYLWKMPCALYGGLSLCTSREAGGRQGRGCQPGLLCSLGDQGSGLIGVFRKRADGLRPKLLRVTNTCSG